MSIPSKLNQAEAGNRIFIGGSSPNLKRLDNNLLSTGVVIGINRWFKHFPCKYWLSSDDVNRTIRQFGSGLRRLDAVKFLPDMPSNTFISHPQANYRFKLSRDPVDILPFWNGYLMGGMTSAVAATHLAIILGASEIVLWAVDLMGDRRFDGTVDFHGDWADRFEIANASFQHLSQFCPIYKTNIDSPLPFPLWSHL